MKVQTLILIESLLKVEEAKADKAYKDIKMKIENYKDLQGYGLWDTDDTLNAMKEEHERRVERCRQITDALADFLDHEWK